MATPPFRSAKVNGRLRPVEILRFIPVHGPQHFTDGSMMPAHCRELAQVRPVHGEHR
jgi:hypothetical protein